MKLYPFALIALLSAACGGGNPTAPSLTSTPSSTVTPSATGSVTTVPPTTTAAAGGISIIGPRSIPPDCLRAAAMPGVLEWRILNVPVSAKIDKGYGHSDTSDCGRTEDNLRTTNDHLRFTRDPSNPTTIIVQFDRDTYSCGHAQIDISVDGVNVLGEVMDYGTGCGAVQDPNECATYIGARSVSGSTATFEVYSGGNVEISLVSYKVDPRTQWFLDYPQIFSAGSGHQVRFGPGVHTISVPVPSVFQTDLLCGGYREENLTPANIADYAPRTIADDSNYWR